jgi:hypothetical protein
MSSNDELAHPITLQLYRFRLDGTCSCADVYRCEKSRGIRQYGVSDSFKLELLAESSFGSFRPPIPSSDLIQVAERSGVCHSIRMM